MLGHARHLHVVAPLRPVRHPSTFGAPEAQLQEAPNPPVKRTRNGMACLAFISFWAKHAMPLRSAYLER